MLYRIVILLLVATAVWTAGYALEHGAATLLSGPSYRRRMSGSIRFAGGMGRRRVGGTRLRLHPSSLQAGGRHRPGAARSRVGGLIRF